jgi:ABC-type sugar transport system ATPase subunit
MATGSATPAVEAVGVGKRFGATVALHDVSVTVERGTIHALIGENGAGKSSFLGVVAGRLAPSDGTVEVFGAPLRFGEPRACREAGIVAIYQEGTIVPAMSAVDNVFLGRPTARAGLVDRAAMEARFREHAERLRVRIDPGVVAGRLSVADQQMLEIMRALESDARVILFDEPTASLAAPEREALLAVMRDLRAEGVTMMFVSHNLDEVKAIADRITVFRDGAVVASGAAAAWTKAGMVEAMLGHAAGEAVARGGTVAPDAPVLLDVDALTVPGILADVDLSVRAGEVIGIGGLVGSGRTTLLRALAGSAPGATATMTVDGETGPLPRSPREALRRGVALIPEDRKHQGLVLSMSAMENVTLGDLRGVRRHGLVSRRVMQRRAIEAGEPYGFRANRMGELARNLSGGNQQKLLLARWAHRPPRVLLCDEPTRGIDIGAKEEILTNLRRLADEGTGIVIVSSELEELEAICDRVVVLAGGRKVGELAREDGDLRASAILHLAFEVEAVA